MSELVLVTGGAGFLASHVVTQLLEANYRVRATARGPKVAQMKERLARFGDQLEVVDVPDIAHDVFPLQGVDGVIHTASPLPGKATPQQILEGAIDGSLNILRQSRAAGIRRFIFTSSVAAAWTPNMTFTDEDWTSIPIEAAQGTDAIVAYMVSKTEAEKAIWAFGEKYPQMDVTVFNPPFLYGPMAEGFPIPHEPAWTAISTDLNVFRLISPHGHFPGISGYLDVRDAARAHVLALNGQNPSPDRKKRFPITSPHAIDFDEVMKMVAEKRPELKSRLVPGPAPKYSKENTVGFTDLKRIEEVIGFKPSEYHSLESTILDTVDSLLELEKLWIANGHTVIVPKIV